MTVTRLSSILFTRRRASWLLKKAEDKMSACSVRAVRLLRHALHEVTRGEGRGSVHNFCFLFGSVLLPENFVKVAEGPASSCKAADHDHTVGDGQSSSSTVVLNWGLVGLGTGLGWRRGALQFVRILSTDFW